MAFKASIPCACSYFTGAIYLGGSIGVLKGEIVFANNTADYGGMAEKCFFLCILGNLKKLFLTKYLVFNGCQGQYMGLYIASSVYIPRRA